MSKTKNPYEGFSAEECAAEKTRLVGEMRKLEDQVDLLSEVEQAAVTKARVDREVERLSATLSPEQRSALIKGVSASIEAGANPGGTR